MDAQTARDEFWDCFDHYIDKQGNKFYVSHVKGGKNQAAGNINNPSPMAMQALCCEYKYRENAILVQVYINNNESLYNKLRSKKTEIETQLGYSVEWIDCGKISNKVKRIQKKFNVNKPFNEMVKIVYPYILDFIKVFSIYL